MPSSTPRPDVAEVTARLREAGCVFAEAEAEILLASTADAVAVTEMVGRRARGEPLEHVVGWARFCEHRIAVSPGVFVPRQRTEFLADRATRATAPRAVVVDLCCGSGAIGAVVAQRRPDVELHAADIDPAALDCARRNLTPLGGRVHGGDLFAALPGDLRGRVDVLVANAPYVPTAALAMLPAEARVHEPVTALDGGSDGLSLLRRIAAAAPQWVAPGGMLLTETSLDQAQDAADALERNGFRVSIAHSATYDATVVTGKTRGSRRTHLRSAVGDERSPHRR